VLKIPDRPKANYPHKQKGVGDPADYKFAKERCSKIAWSRRIFSVGVLKEITNIPGAILWQDPWEKQ